MHFARACALFLKGLFLVFAFSLPRNRVLDGGFSGASSSLSIEYECNKARKWYAGQGVKFGEDVPCG